MKLLLCYIEHTLECYVSGTLVLNAGVLELRDGYT